LGDDDGGEGAPPRQRDWGLGGLLSPEEEEAAVEAAAAMNEYQPRLAFGRHQQREQQHNVIDLQSEPEEEDEEDEEDGAEDSASLWGRIATELRVRWLLWKNQARYRLQGKGSAGGGGKRYS
jgi:hypothetical protein